MERAVDSDNVTLAKHFLEIHDATATNFLLLFRRKGLVIVVEKFLAIEWLQAAQNTLANSADGYSTDNLSFKVELTLGCLGDIPSALLNHLMGRDEVSDQDEDSHNDMLCNRHNIGPCDLCYRDTAVGLVSSVEVDMVRTDPSRDGKLELLSLGQALCSKISGVEARKMAVSKCLGREWHTEASAFAEDAYGVVISISASTSSWSNLEFSPSLSEVVTRVCPASSSHFRMPSSFSVVPRRSGTY